MQGHVAGHKGIGPAQRAHGDVVRRPVANAGQFFQRGNGRRHVGPGVQCDALAGHRLGNADDGRLALLDDAQLPQRVAAGLCQHLRRGEQARQLGVGRLNRFAKPGHHALRQSARRRHRDLLAQHRAHRQLKAVQRAWHTQAVALGKVAVQNAVDGRRVGVQIEPGAHPADHQGQHLAQRITHAQHDLATWRVKLGQQPARMDFATRFNAKCPSSPRGMGVIRYKFNSIYGALAYEGQHRPHVIRRPKPELDGDALRVRPTARIARAAQLGRVQFVVRHKGRVEAPQARIPAAQRHLGDGQVGVGQQLLGGEQAARLQILQRRHAKLRLENTPHMAVAHPHALAEFFDRGRRIPPALGLVQHPRRLVRQHGAGILRRPARSLRRQLGPAAQARAKTGAFSLRGVVEETAVRLLGRFDLADRAAVNAGGRDPREKAAVKACVARRQRAVTGVGVRSAAGVEGLQGFNGGHGIIIGRCRLLTSRFRTCSLVAEP